MGRTSRIHVLSPAVVNKIAAGEVIERPASAIKELMENSIDALCTRIDVAIEQGGTELIRIVDDGEGIEPEDLPLAVTSHATSKLQRADDLFCVNTMGFRGEALASIAEVSLFRIAARTEEAAVGAELLVRYGEREEVRPCGMALGTSIEIRQLFANTPVRRKFLKKAGTEFGYISEQFSRIALAHPRLQLSLTHNGKIVYRLPPHQQLHERILLFYGNELAGKLIPIEAEHHGVRLWGFVGHPSCHKATRKSQYLYLNGRYIQDRSLQHALNEGYRGLIMGGRYPVAFLFLEMPGDQVDVNVHPTKAEVRFRDAQLLFRLLLSTLRTRFLQSDLHSELTIRQPSQPTESLETKQRKMERDLISWARQQLEQQLVLPSKPVDLPAAASTVATEITPSAERFQAAEVSPVFAAEAYNPERNQTDKPLASSLPQSATNFSPQSTETLPATGQQHQPAPVPLSAEQSLQPGIRALQVDDCYLVLSTDQGLTVIDQHALHERVLYERIRKKVLDHKVEVQKLLVPITLDLPDDLTGLLLDEQEILQQLGFDVSDFGGGTLVVTSHPVFLGHQQIETVLRELAERMQSDEKISRRDLLDSSLHMMACKAAIKAGQRLTTDEIISLLAQRDLVEDAHHCPHGRPTALILSREELDRQFGRLGV